MLVAWLGFLTCLEGHKTVVESEGEAAGKVFLAKFIISPLWPRNMFPFFKAYKDSIMLSK